jgi:hypothetical protein
VPRANPAAVIVREELRLVGRHIYIHGAIAFTAFASQAEIQRFFHVPVTPAAFERIALQHLKQEPGAPPSGVHLFPGDTITGAHGPTMLAPALAHADAPDGRSREARFIVGKVKMRSGIGGTIIRAEP